MTKSFHPKLKIVSDLPRNGLNSFTSLAKLIRQNKMTLVLGAGVSASAGLPSWTLLLRRIVSTYFAHWEFDKQSGNASNASPPRNLSIAFWEEFHWSDQTKKIAEELVNREDLLHLAQMIKARVRSSDWSYLVSKSLYRRDSLPPTSKLLKDIAGLCANEAIDAEVLSYNYDNLVEVALSELAVRTTCLWEGRKETKIGTVPIYYPHGYLKHGGGPKVSIVLGEDDYHQYATNQYGWNNSIQLRQFLRSTCVFLGFSLTDPQVRRLLWVTKESGGERHYAFLPTPTNKDDKAEMLESLFDAQLRDVNVYVIRYSAGPDGRDHSRLSELISMLGALAENPSPLWE